MIGFEYPFHGHLKTYVDTSICRYTIKLSTKGKADGSVIICGVVRVQD